MVERVPPYTQTDAVGRASMGNMKVFEVSLFMPVAVLALLFFFFLTSVSVASLCTQLTQKDLQLFCEVAAQTHVNIVRLACNYYSKVKEWIDP